MNKQMIGGYPNFLGRWERSQRLHDGLVHAFSPTREQLKYENGAIEVRKMWAPFCAKGLHYDTPPGQTCDRLIPITCVLCLGAAKT